MTKEKTKDDIRREARDLVLAMIGKAKKSLAPAEFQKLLDELASEIARLRGQK